MKAHGDYRLKKPRYRWFANYSDDEADAHFDELKNSQLKVARAWLVNQGTVRGFWEYQVAGWATCHFDAWYSWVIRSCLQPIKIVARMILDNIMTGFKHPISNSVSEGLNSKIQTVTSR